MNNQYVLVISPRDNEVDLVKELGYGVILIRKNISFDEMFSVEVPVEIDLNDEEIVVGKCKELSEKYNVVGVYTLNEYRIPLAAKVGEILEINSFLSYETAITCRNKKLARKKLNDSNVSSVKFVLIRKLDNLNEKLEGFSFPVIVKPSNDSGSKNVYLCKDYNEVKQAVDVISHSKLNLVGQTLDPEAIVEEYLDGPEYSIESYTIDGKTTIVGVTEKVVTPFPLSVEVGHNFPAVLEEDIETSIHETVINALDVIGVDFGVTHTEVKVTSDGPKVIEVNARPGGDRITDLVEYVTGIDLRRIALRINLGLPIKNSCCNKELVSSSSIRFLIADKEGYISFNENFRAESIKEIHWYVNKGERVNKTTSNFDRIGYYIVDGNKKESSKKIADSLNECFELAISELVEM